MFIYKYVLFLVLFLGAVTQGDAKELTDVTIKYRTSSNRDQGITFGQTFKKGDVPAGYSLNIQTQKNDIISSQSDIKSTYRDGSVRHAIFSLILPKGKQGKILNADIKTRKKSKKNSAVSLQDVLHSNYDLVIKLSTYTPHIQKILFGDRKTKWKKGDQIELIIDDKIFSYTIKNNGNSFKIGEKAAQYFSEQINKNTDYIAEYTYERLYIRGKKQKNLKVTVNYSGKSPVTQSRVTSPSKVKKYTISARQSLLEAFKNNRVIQWLNGPVASEWLVVVPLIDPVTKQEHPDLSLRLYIRAYKGLKQFKTDVVIENSWAFSKKPKNQFYDIKIQSDGKTVYQKDNFQHYTHSRWKKTVWFGYESDISISHDIDYLLATKALPNYDRSIKISDKALTKLSSNWKGKKTQPMNVGYATKYMPATGAHQDIGPLPRWQVLYLLSMDDGAKKVTIESADLSGTWGIHFRNRKTGYPVTLDDFPYMTIRGNYSDTYNPKTKKFEAFPKCGGYCRTPFAKDIAHQPSFAYLPYLISGDYYYLEELQFWATYNAFESNPGYREAGENLPKRGTLRGMAWSLRTLGHAAAITPDKHELKEFFLRILNNQINFFTKKYVNNPGANKLGIIRHGYALGYSNKRGIAPWQDDFFTWSIGHLVEQDFTQAIPLLKWKAKFPVGRMTDQKFCWILAAKYSLIVRKDIKSPIFQSLGEVYKFSVNKKIQDIKCASKDMAKALKLRSAGEMLGYSRSPSGYPSIMQPALAVAYDNKVKNSERAWKVFINRSVKPDYSQYPNWAIMPREKIKNIKPKIISEEKSHKILSQNSQKKIMAGDVISTGSSEREKIIAMLSDNTAIDLGVYNCSGRGPEGESDYLCKTISDYSGMVRDPITGRFLMFGGGHAATARTDIDVFDFSSMNWKSAYKSTACNNMTKNNFNKDNVSWKATGHPVSRHTYDLLGVISKPHEFIIMRPRGGADSAQCGGFGKTIKTKIAHYNFTKKNWSYSVIGQWTDYAASEYDPKSGRFVLVGGGGIYSYDPVQRKQAVIKKFSRSELGYANNLVYFPPNDHFYYITRGKNISVYELTLDRNNWNKTTLKKIDNIKGDAPGTPETGWAYDSINHLIGGGIVKGLFHAYDPVKKSWIEKRMETKSTNSKIGTQAFHVIEYSPEINAYVFKTLAQSGHRIWIYRYKNNRVNIDAN